MSFHESRVTNKVSHPAALSFGHCGDPARIKLQVTKNRDGAVAEGIMLSILMLMMKLDVKIEVPTLK